MKADDMMFFIRKLAKQERDTLDSLRPVILMGRGHSGTRMFAWICQLLGINLGISESKHSGDAEDLEFTRQIKKIAAKNFRNESDHKPAESDLERLRHSILQYYRGLGSPQGLWGWKFPETYLIAPMILTALPEAIFIHIIRDGRDIAFKRHLTDNPKRPLGKKLLKHLNALNTPHHIQAALSWAYQVDLFDRFKPRLKDHQLLEISFESMCLDPGRETQRICRFVGIPMTPECEEFIQHKIIPTRVAQYREYDAGKVAEIEDVIRPVLERYGYMP